MSVVVGGGDLSFVCLFVILEMYYVIFVYCDVVYIRPPSIKLFPDEKIILDREQTTYLLIGKFYNSS